MKVLKWPLTVGGGLLAVVIGALLLIPLLVNVEKYKSGIEKQVSSAAGRPFAIDGPIRLSLFPWAGVALSDLHLGSPPGYEETNFLFVKSLDVRMKLLPLLSKQVQVRRLVIGGPKVVLARDKAGRGNWEAWGTLPAEGAPRTGAPPAPKGPAEGFPLKSLAVGQLAVRNGSVLYIDHASASRQEVSDIDLELKDVSLDRPIRVVLSAAMDGVPISLEGHIGPMGLDPGKGKIPVDVSLKAFREITADLKGHLQDPTTDLQFDLAVALAPFSLRKVFAALKAPFPVATADSHALSHVGLKSRIRGSTHQVDLTDGVLDLDESKISFSATTGDFSKPDLTFDLSLDAIDLDRYLPPASKTAGAEPEPAQSIRTDYTALRKLVLNGQARVGMLSARGMKFRDLDLKVTGRNGVIQVDPLVANLYNGTLSAAAALDVRQDAPGISLALKTRGVHAGPLLQDFLKKDLLEGTANAEATVSMAGDAPSAIKKSLSGQGQVVVANGAIKGIDLAGMMRNVTSAFALAGTPGGSHTDFVELNVPFNITRGVVSTSTTNLVSPLLRVLATGRASLVDESLDLRMEPKFVGILKGAGGILEQSGVPVAVLVRGTFSSPSFQPDIGGLLEKGLMQVLPEALKPPEGKSGSVVESIRNILKGLTGPR